MKGLIYLKRNINAYKQITGSQLFSFKFNSFSSKDTKKKEVKKADFKDTMKYIKPYFSSTRVLFATTIGVTVLAKGLIAISPYFLKLTVDSLIAKQSIGLSLSYLLGFASAKIIGTSILEYRVKLQNEITNSILIEFTDDMLKYLFTIDYKQFKHNSQDIISSFNKSTQGIESLNRFVLSNIIANTVEFGLVSLFLFYFIGLKYCVVTMGTYAVYLYATQKIIAYRNPIMNEKFKCEMQQEGKISEIIFNVDTVKYFQQEKKETVNAITFLKALRNQENKVVSSLAFLNSTQHLIITSGMVLGLTLGVFDCYSGNTSPGDLIMLQTSFAQIMQPLFFLGTIMRSIAETRVRLSFAIDTLKNKEILEKDKLLKEGQLVDFENKGCEIKFENVEFSFHHGEKKSEDKEHYILKDINLEFKKGSFNAIVGRSGQGKSTIFNLLYKFYLPTQGRILIDNQNITSLKEESFRQYMTICPQNGNLFNQSILYNIGYPLEDNSNVEKEVTDISKSLNIYEKINSLDKGFNSNVGTLGSKLSGGEKQRVLLARALIKSKAQIVILDEPTSNLDSHNEKIVMDFLLRLKNYKTVIICTHKLNTLTMCDNINVLSHGRIIESGSHKDLLSNPGSYYSQLNKNYFSMHE